MGAVAGMGAVVVGVEGAPHLQPLFNSKLSKLQVLLQAGVSHTRHLHTGLENTSLGFKGLERWVLESRWEPLTL